MAPIKLPNMTVLMMASAIRFLLKDFPRVESEGTRVRSVWNGFAALSLSVQLWFNFLVWKTCMVSWMPLLFPARLSGTKKRITIPIKRMTWSQLQSGSFRTVAAFVPRTYNSSVKNEHRSALTTHHSKITPEDRPNSHSKKHGAVEPAFTI